MGSLVRARDEPDHFSTIRALSTSGIRKLTSNPVSDAGFQHVEWQASSAEDFIMEGSEVEAGTKLLLSAIAEIENLKLADLVAEALSRPCNIPVNLSLDRRLRRRFRGSRRPPVRGSNLRSEFRYRRRGGRHASIPN